MCRRGSFLRFRPCVFGFSLLAVAVALWGYGYRVSLYRPQPENGLRIPAAKLWVEHRNSARVSVDSAQTAPDFFSLTALPEVSLPRWIEREAVSWWAPTLHAATPGSLIPFRSPPILPLRCS
jgi:hypothetical protein